MFDLATLRRARRAGRALGRGAARRRDLPRPHPRRRRCRWRRRCSPRVDQRVVDVEGLRAARAAVGWAVCRDAELAETLLAAKEQMVICGATLDEAIAGTRARRPRRRILPADPRRRAGPPRDRARRGWPRQDTFEWIEPDRRRRRPRARSRPTSPSTPTASTRCCSPSTARTSGPATGSRSTTATSGSASAGRPRPSCAPGSAAARPRPPAHRRTAAA